MDRKVNVVITLGRQFGSGGRELGRRLADRLGIAYYDKEILSRVASGTGLAREYMEENDERKPGFLGSMLQLDMGFSPMSWYQMPSPISSDSIYTSQSETIRRIAREESCVIVGRTADYILRDYPNVVKVFVHAPLDDCIDRIVARSEGYDRAKARTAVLRTNKLRAGYYNFYTEKRWGDASNYDLTFDTSKIDMEDIVEIVVDYINRRFAAKK